MPQNASSRGAQVGEQASRVGRRQGRDQPLPPPPELSPMLRTHGNRILIRLIEQQAIAPLSVSWGMGHMNRASATRTPLVPARTHARDSHAVR